MFPIKGPRVSLLRTRLSSLGAGFGLQAFIGRGPRNTNGIPSTTLNPRSLKPKPLMRLYLPSSRAPGPPKAPRIFEVSTSIGADVYLSVYENVYLYNRYREAKMKRYRTRGREERERERIRGREGEREREREGERDRGTHTHTHKREREREPDCQTDNRNSCTNLNDPSPGIEPSKT